MTHIAIIGAGIVGTATGKGFMHIGHSVTFCDVNDQRIETLRAAGYSACKTEDLTDQPIDVVMVTISTPTVEGRMQMEYLLSGVRDVAKHIVAKAKKRMTVVIRSSVLPGTTETVIIPELERHSGKRAGHDFGVCMNPEFLRARSPDDDFLRPKGIIIGAIDEASAEALSRMYEPLNAPIHVCSPREAEMAKYCSNIFDACKISFFNEMRTVGDAASIDSDRVFHMVKELCEACWNPGYGLRDEGPFNGMCLPKDSEAFLTWSQKTLNLPMHILRGVIAENDDMKEYFPRRHKLAKGIIRAKKLWGKMFLKLP